MGLGSPISRRKRKRGINLDRRIEKGSSVVLKIGLVVLALLCTFAFVSKLRRRKRAVGLEKHSHALPLMMLLQHHDISARAAKFADPEGSCLSVSTRNGTEGSPFACVADAILLVEVLRAGLGLESFLEVLGGGDVDHRLDYALKAGQVADMVFLKLEEDLPEKDMSSNIDRWMKAVSPEGVMVLHPQQGLAQSSTWPGAKYQRPSTAPGLWAAVEEKWTCRQGEATAAVGNFDGGVIVLRHPRLLTDPSWAGDPHSPCGKHGSDVDSVGSQAPPLLSFEGLYLWATGRNETQADVLASFGGAEALTKNFLRRVSRASCLSGVQRGVEVGEGAPGEQGLGKTSSRKVSSLRPEGSPVAQVGRGLKDVEACLRRHIRRNPGDVRAVFALLAASAQAGSDLSLVWRAKKEALASAGELGASLWSRLCRDAALAATEG